MLGDRTLGCCFPSLAFVAFNTGIGPIMSVFGLLKLNAYVQTGYFHTSKLILRIDDDKWWNVNAGKYSNGWRFKKLVNKVDLSVLNRFFLLGVCKTHNIAIKTKFTVLLEQNHCEKHQTIRKVFGVVDNRFRFESKPESVHNSLPLFPVPNTLAMVKSVWTVHSTPSGIKHKRNAAENAIFVCWSRLRS